MQKQLQETLIVIAFKKNKYIISVLVIIFSCTVFLFTKKGKENIYIFYEGKPSNCFNVHEDDKKNYYVFCKEKNSIFFRKKKKEKIINSEKINLISKELLFERFREYGSGKNINFFIVKKKTIDKITKVIPVEKVVFWY